MKRDTIALIVSNPTWAEDAYKAEVERAFAAAEASQPDAPEGEPVLRPEYADYLRAEQAKLDRAELQHA